MAAVVEQLNLDAWEARGRASAGAREARRFRANWPLAKGHMVQETSATRLAEASDRSGARAAPSGRARRAMADACGPWPRRRAQGATASSFSCSRTPNGADLPPYSPELQPAESLGNAPTNQPSTNTFPTSRRSMRQSAAVAWRSPKTVQVSSPLPASTGGPKSQIQADQLTTASAVPATPPWIEWPARPSFKCGIAIHDRRRGKPPPPAGPRHAPSLESSPTKARSSGGNRASRRRITFMSSETSVSRNKSSF